MTELALFAGIILVYCVWAYRVARGVRFRPVLAGVLTALYLTLFFAFQAASGIGPSWLFVLNLVLLLLAADIAFVVAVRSTRVLQDARGRFAFRGSPAVVFVWLVILLLEIYVQQLFLGDVTVLHYVIIHGVTSPIPVPPGLVAHPYMVTLAVVDALFAVGTGMAVGTNLGVYVVFARINWGRSRSARARTS